MAQGARASVQSTDAEYVLSLIGLITAVGGQPIPGLIISIIALRESKSAGRDNLYARLGLIFGIVFSAFMVLGLLGYLALELLAVFMHGRP